MAIVSDFRLAGDDDGVSFVAAVRELFNHDSAALIITAELSPKIDGLCAEADISLLRKPIAADQLLAFLRSAADATRAAPAAS